MGQNELYNTVTMTTDRLEELLEPLVSGVLAAGDDDVGDVGGPVLIGYIKLQKSSSNN